MSVASQSFPPGICTWDHMPYGFRRWNGTVWAEAWVDRYNRQIDLIRRRFEDGWHVDDHVEDWYRMLTHFDLLAKELGTRD
ncbi:hypothetical protein O4328_28780 [Rhodococcus opacus]|uniref:Transposase n=1 Tax=Rhodococcus opacus TaxID=37919 RepID=A0AAX3YTA8_RHOOP|nr:hypothetical protein [Rhodococcus opacus]MCZ4587636.1 hypothetical protein [Rhodococcus opacus]WLF51368.1 hypothetical protein Q5707_37480 [Rhodococcus opacus]